MFERRKYVVNAFMKLASGWGHLAVWDIGKHFRSRSDATEQKNVFILFYAQSYRKHLFCLCVVRIYLDVGKNMHACQNTIIFFSILFYFLFFIFFSCPALPVFSEFSQGFIRKYYSRLSLSRTPRDSMKQFEISVLRHIRFADSGKQLIEQPPLTEWICNLTPKLETFWKYCGKEEKLLLRSNFSSFPQYFIACW